MAELTIPRRRSWEIGAFVKPEASMVAFATLSLASNRFGDVDAVTFEERRPAVPPSPCKRDDAPRLDFVKFPHEAGLPDTHKGRCSVVGGASGMG